MVCQTPEQLRTPCSWVLRIAHVLTKLILVFLGVWFRVYKKKFEIDCEFACGRVSWAIPEAAFSSGSLYLVG